MTITFDEATHSYTLDNDPVPSVTTILKSGGFIDTAFFTDGGRTRGTYVHSLVQYHLAGELDESTVDDSLAGYFDAFKLFCTEADTDTDTWTVEKPLASKVYRFAGTPDFVGIINGKCAVIDLKTSITVSPSEQLQTAAYRQLLTERGWGGNVPVTHRFSLHVSSEGKYKLIEHKDRQDWQIFLAALACYQWKINHGRTR